MNRKYLLLIGIPLLLSQCGGMTPEDLSQSKSDITSIMEGQAATSEKGVALRATLNEIHTTLSTIAGYTPDNIGAGGAGKAFHIMSNIDGVLRILVGATATADDIRQFINSQIGSTSNSAFAGQASAAYFDNIFKCHFMPPPYGAGYPRNMVLSGLGPSVMTKLLNTQAKYAAVVIQYMVQLIPSMGKDQVKTTLSMAESALNTLNKSYIAPPQTTARPGTPINNPMNNRMGGGGYPGGGNGGYRGY